MSNQTFSIWDGSVASSFGGGTGTESNPYLINSAAQLAYLAEVFNDPNVLKNKNTYYSKYYKLTSNIDLDKREWAPIGCAGIPDYLNCAIFFDGDNHIVRGLYIDRPEEDNLGLFGSVSKTSSFKNITIEAAHVSGKYNVGGLIGQFAPNYGGIENCHFSGEIYGYHSGGGIVGSSGGVLKDCTNAGTITVELTGGGIAGLYGSWCGEVLNCVNTGTIIGKDCMGGIIGLASETTVFKYCQNSGDVINRAENGAGISHAGSYEYCSNSGNISGAGGITHHCSGGYIKNCHNSGTITKEGDIVGGLTGSANNATIELCTNTGTVNGTGWRTGGICGQSKGSSTIEYCTNEGAVNSSGPGRVGGIVGEGNHVIQCNNTGTVKGVIYGAGICGYSEAEDSLIAGCVNDGFIEATRFGAGIAGYFKGTVQNCINMAPIQTNSGAAGIVCEGGIAVKNCYNTGSITGSFSLGGIIYSTLVEGFTLEKNYNSGEIGSTSSSGGILGYLKHDGGQIIDCHYHAGSAQKGIGTHPVNVSIEATGYVDSVVSADDPKTVPAMLTQSIMVNTLAATLLFWSKKKQQLLTQISRLVSISKSLGVGQDEEPLDEIAGNDMYLVTEHVPVRESVDPSSNIIAMSFKKDVVKVLPQTRSAQGDYYQILTEENQVGLLPSASLVPANIQGSGNTSYTIIADRVAINNIPSRWGKEVGFFQRGDIVQVVPGERSVEEDGTYWIKVYFNQTNTGWVKENLIKEGSGQTTIAVGNSIIGYSGQSDSGGRSYQIDGTTFSTYRYNVINNVIKPYYNYATSPDWWAPELLSGAHVNQYAYDPQMTPYPVATADVKSDAYGMLVNPEGRYWIAVGPTIMNAKYNADKTIKTDTMKYGCKIDILLQHTDSNHQPQQVWLYCILGDAKNHTFDGTVNGTYIDGQGIFQTGFDPTGNWEKDNMDASMVEFMRTVKDQAINVLSDYKLVKIVIYDL